MYIEIFVTSHLQATGFNITGDELFEKQVVLFRVSLFLTRGKGLIEWYSKSMLLIYIVDIDRKEDREWRLIS